MAAARSISRESTVQSIVKAYRDGWSLSELADKHRVAVTTIRNYLLENKVKLRPRGGRKS